MGRVINATPRPLYPRERPSTCCAGGWVGPRSGMGGYPTGIRSPDLTARRESLYRLSYPGPQSQLLDLTEVSTFRSLLKQWFRLRTRRRNDVRGLISPRMEQNVIRWPESNVFHKTEAFTQYHCIVCN